MCYAFRRAQPALTSNFIPKTICFYLFKIYTKFLQSETLSVIIYIFISGVQFEDLRTSIWLRVLPLGNEELYCSKRYSLLRYPENSCIAHVLLKLQVRAHFLDNK